MNTNLTTISDYLKENGWKIYKVDRVLETCDFMWLKQFKDVVPHCYCNEKGIQLSLKCWDHRIYKLNRQHSINSRLGFELELAAEPKDGVWVKLMCYGLCDADIIEKLDSQCNKLIRAWKAINED